MDFGFGGAPVARTIYIGNNGDYCWYFWENDRAVPIEGTSLTCTISGVSIENKEYKDVMTRKLLLHVIAGSDGYTIKSSLETVFSRGLLLKLCALSPEELQQPLMIAVKPGKDKTVLANLFRGDKSYVQAIWDRETAAIDLYAKLEVLLGVKPKQHPAQTLDEGLIKSKLMEEVKDCIKILQASGSTKEEIKALYVEKFGSNKLSDLDSAGLQYFLGCLEELKALKDMDEIGIPF
jgi:hypothetical protein